MKKLAYALAALLFIAGSIAVAQTPSVPMGSINGVTAGAGLGGGGTLGNVSLSSSIAVNRQLGTSYMILTSDQAKLVTFANLSSVAVSLPTAGGAGFAAGWWAFLSNYGPATLTVTPISGTIGGFSSLQIQSNVGIQIVSDGANWQITGNQSTAGFVTVGSNNIWTGTNNFTGGFSINGTALTLPVSVPNGGTGSATLTANAILLGNGTAAVSSVTSAAAGLVLTSNGSSPPTFQSTSGGVSSIASGNGITTTPSPITSTGTVALANIPTSRVLGNVSGSTSGPISLTMAQLTTLINIFNSSTSGAVPASGGGTSNFLRADGTFASPTTANSFQETVFTGSGTFTTAANSSTSTVYWYEIVGGGGGGGGSNGSTGAGGGGAACTAIGTFTLVAANTAVSVTVGAAGAAGSGAPGAGGTGGNSIIGTPVSITAVGGAGSGAAAGTAASIGGVGCTTATGSNQSINGGDGNVGGNDVGTNALGGTGGASSKGGGGKGGITGTAAGTNGKAFGSGGGGAANGAGGAGAIGLVTIRRMSG